MFIQLIAFGLIGLCMESVVLYIPCNVRDVHSVFITGMSLDRMQCGKSVLGLMLTENGSRVGEVRLRNRTDTLVEQLCTIRL